MTNDDPVINAGIMVYRLFLEYIFICQLCLIFNFARNILMDDFLVKFTISKYDFIRNFNAISV